MFTLRIFHPCHTIYKRQFGRGFHVTIPLSLRQNKLDSYLARLGLNFGWLFIIDRRTNAPSISERLTLPHPPKSHHTIEAMHLNYTVQSQTDRVHKTAVAAKIIPDNKNKIAHQTVNTTSIPNQIGV